MTTYVIGLLVVALVYGLFWNNRSAQSYADSPPAQPNPPENPGSKREGAARAGSYPDGASIPISAGHQSQRTAS